ncbi:MAG: hypothetical protein A2W03_03150 [Candidatus Aminicenantes bacterium RBG_16_63_16]|nr:MAG: hypothetical protein A2W03_03150 [Candidatus Aminicenantes bacterium RBG_16_63_16]
MIQYDLCLAWNWEYDLDFLCLLREAFRKRRLFLLEVSPGVLESSLRSLERREAGIRVLLDRASECDARFLPLVSWAISRGVHEINAHGKAVSAMNKASMHLEFITAGIHTPYTIILPPWNEQAHLGTIDLQPLGVNFFIKPAHGGGGEGVVREASTLTQVAKARQQFPNDHYLLQARVKPAELGGRPGWFRVIYCGGLIFPCWWDPETHVYAPVTGDEVELYGLEALSSTAAAIARVCGLDIFSTEIAMITARVPVAVDYVNHPIDLRLGSVTPDGVPDAIVNAIAGRIADLTRDRLRELTAAR